MSYKSTFVCFFFLLVTIKSTYGQLQYEWVQTFGNVGEDRVQDFYLDATGNAYVIGFYYDSIDIDPGPDSLILDAGTNADCFIEKLDPSGNLIWGITIGGNGSDNGIGIVADELGNVYCVGAFSNTADFDPGPAEFLKSSIGGDLSSDIFILKLDVNGNFVWVKTIGNSGAIWGCMGVEVTLDEDNNIYFGGLISGTLDVNPGPVNTTFTSIDALDLLVEKLDNDGNFIWAKQFGGYNQQFVEDLIINGSSLFVSGSFYSTVDFDPGPGVFNLTSAGNSDIYFVELSLTGTFIHAGKIGDIDSESPGGIAFDSEGNRFYTGTFIGTVDLDMEPLSDSIVTSAGSRDCFLIKTDSLNNLIWAKTIGDEYPQLATAICIDSLNNIILSGYFQNTFDADPGPGISNLVSAGYYDIYYLKLNNDGDFIYASSVGGPDSDGTYDFSIDKNGDFYSAGNFSGTLDFAPGDSVNTATAYGGLDAYVLKLRQLECSNFGLKIDSVADRTCAMNGYAGGHAFSGLLPFDYEWNTLPATYDSVANFDTIGIFTLTATDAEGCIRTSSVLINGPTTITDYDLQANLITENFNPGNHTNIWIDAFNDGCIPVTGSLMLVLDTLIQFDSADINPDFIYGDTLIWNFTDFIYDSSHLMLQLFVTTSEYALITDTINLHLEITPIDMDVDSTNNFRDYAIKVLAPVDPNMKFVYPQGICDAGYVVQDQILTYTLMFQNTGTSEAINIYLLDSLSEWLDLNTVNVVGKSHEMFTEVLPGNVLKFVFNDIYLPDSTSNEPESHGYVIFEVKPIAAAPLGSVIENNTAIYFDFNEPVITNTVINTLIETLPILTSTQSIAICDGESFSVGINTYTSPGIYIDHFDSYFGCDSTVTTILSLLPKYNITQHPEICEGESITIGAHIYTTEGTYIDTLYSTLGCDSIVTTILSLYPKYNITQYLEICEGESIAVGDHIYTSGGTYIDSLNSILGCDSVIFTNLTVHPDFYTIIDTSICYGNNFLFNDSLYAEAGEYTALFSSIYGCDSMVQLILNVNQIDVTVNVTDTTFAAQTLDAAYQWVDCINDFQPIVGATGQLFKPDLPGEYAVIISQYGCVDTSACFEFFPLVISNFNNLSSIFPNPTSGYITIKMQRELTGAIIKIYEYNGRIVLEENIESKQMELNISTLPDGCYMLEIANSEFNQIQSLIKSSE